MEFIVEIQNMWIEVVIVCIGWGKYVFKKKQKTIEMWGHYCENVDIEEMWACPISTRRPLFNLDTKFFVLQSFSPLSLIKMRQVVALIVTTDDSV